MKKYLYLMLITSMIILVSIHQTSVYALQLSGGTWNSNKYYQGDSGTIHLTLYNENSLAQWYIKTVSIQFDWQVQSNYVYSTNVGQAIASGQTGAYDISFDIPPSTSVGSHSYTLYYVGIFNDQHQVGSGTLSIHDLYEKQYDGMISSVQSQLNSASNYNSLNARSDIDQARSYFVQATTLASQGQYQSAIDKLNQVQNMINQADSEEQSYRSSSYNSEGYSKNNYYSNSGDSFPISTTLIEIVIFAVVAVGGGIAYWKIKTRIIHTKTQSAKKSKDSVSTNQEPNKDALHISAPIENTAEKERIVEKINPKIKPIIPKIKKTKDEIEQDKKALGILKERLATGTIAKSEYDKLKKEFEGE